MNETPRRRGQQAKTEEVPSSLRDMFPGAGMASLSINNAAPDEDDMFFEAQYEGRTRRWEDAVDDDGTLEKAGLSKAGGTGAPLGAIVTGTHPDEVRMWKPTPNGYSMRVIKVTSIKQNLQNGWKSRCPDCGRNDHGGGPNDCPARPKVKYSICPICEEPHPVYDNYQISSTADFLDLEKDPAFVQFDAFKNSTPEARVEAGMTVHMWAKHPQETRAMGIAPLAEPSLTVLETMLATGPQSNPLMGGAS